MLLFSVHKYSYIRLCASCLLLIFFNSCFAATVESKSFSDITMQAKQGFKIFMWSSHPLHC